MKKGDILELIDNGGMRAPIGSTARVIGVRPSMVDIEWIDEGESCQMNGEYNSYRFKVITSPEEAFEKQNSKTMSKQKLTVSITDVMKIHAIACNSWKTTIATQYLSRLDNKQNITFTQHEVDAMFKAASPEQVPVLEEVFGKQSKPIQWDKIKTGSQVMVKHTGNHCIGFTNIDSSKPVDVIFFNTPHYMCSDTNGVDFNRKFANNVYCTFHQKGKLVLFQSNDKAYKNFITEVIEY